MFYTVSQDLWNQGCNLHLKPPQQITPCGHNKSARDINEAY